MAALVEVTDTQDIVSLRTPRGSRALPVMRVVLGWVASCHDLPLDRLDDVQLAVETLCAEEPEEGGELSLALTMVQGQLTVRLEGLQNHLVKANLLATDVFRPCEGCRLDVSLFLGALVNAYRVVADQSDSFAVEMTKRVF
jgi:hypothetical protein